MEIIKRNFALEVMSIKELPNGKKNIFSIKFVDKEGKLRYFPHAVATGAGRMNNYQCRVRGVQPTCPSGNPEGHIYPVRIDRIVEFNSMRVIL